MSTATEQLPSTSRNPVSSTTSTQHRSGQVEGIDDSESEAPAISRIPTSDLMRRQMAHCGEYTFQALNKIGKLSPEDTGRITQQYLKYLQNSEKGKPFRDALEFLFFEGWKRPEIEARDTILKLTRALIAYSKTKISHLAFAHQTDTPIEFYNAFPAISEICRLLGSPVIQVSEKDFFSVTSINPFTATAAARLIANEVQHETGKKPFHFVSTTDMNAWKYLQGRHFGS
ncbi:MAG: hypothetical protein KA250_02145 [Verrucomicrobiales bacterium]|jgi:hypothetical protein|nr:hypothetical protein [Verrucomicrobiales bacterium]MBP9226058.1 hypothetical protein [Verrucomicrobiales bacterium]HQZ27948.1 hypothetical protein [Verrucomicrobiales bacterium]